MKRPDGQTIFLGSAILIALVVAIVLALGSSGDREAESAQRARRGIDWAKVREQLASLRFEGWATAEVRGGDRERLADIAGQMNRVLDL